MLVINAILLIMACMGVGSTGYDYNMLTCYMKTWLWITVVCFLLLKILEMIGIVKIL